jgi:hypothetical protein
VFVVAILHPTFSTVRRSWSFVPCVALIDPPTAFITTAIAITPTMLAIPTMPPLAPIAAILLAHGIPASKDVEQKDAVAGIVIIVVPAAAKTDVAERLSIIAVIISVIAGIRVTAIRVVIIAVAGEAEADIIHAA